MSPDRTHEVEASLGLLPLPEIPPALSALVAEAGAALAAYSLDDDEAALPELVRLMDECVAHPGFDGAGRRLRIRLLSRAGVVHNWYAAALADLGEYLVSVSLLERARALCTDADVDLPRVDYNISNARLRRYQFGGTPADLDEAEDAARRGLARPSAEVHCLLQEAMSQVLGVHFRLQGGLTLINEAVERAEDAVSSCREARQRRLRHHSSLAQALNYRYQATGALPDLDRTIALLEEVEQAPDKPWQLRGAAGKQLLGVAYRQRYLRTRNRQDIDAAVGLLSTDADLKGDQPVALTNLGNALLDRYDSAGDDEDLRAALRLQEEAVRRTGAGDWQLASRYNNLGNALSRAGQVWDDRALTSAAADSYRAALALTEEEAQERASREYNLATVLAELAGGRRRGRQVQEAVTTYRAAIRDGLTGSLEWAHSAATSWGDWAVRRQAWAEAAEAYGQALDIARRLFRVQLLRAQKEAWLAQSQGVPGEAAYALFRLGRPQDAVRALESGRGLLISEVLDRDRADLTALAGAGRDDLVLAYQDAASALDRAVNSPTGATEVQECRQALDDVTSQIRTVPGYERFLTPPDLPEIAAAARAGRVIVYLAHAWSAGAALIVDASGQVRAAELPACTTQAIQRRVQLLNRVRRDHGDTPAALAGALDAVARWCWDAILGPVTRATSARRLVLVPSGLLALLPLHAAWTVTQPGRCYLADERTVSYVPSARAAAPTRAARDGSGTALLVVTDPRPTPLPPLQHVAAEVAAASHHFPGTVRIDGPGAVPSAVTAALPRAQVAHFICHGASNPEHPMESCLFLAEGERLALRDILDLRLRQPGGQPRLCVLSACQTDQPGTRLPDEVVSLPTGLLQAGYAGVLATQWPVRGEVAALIVGHFYRAWREEGTEPAEALAQAQRWLRDTTNAQKLVDLLAWWGESAFGSVRRSLRLRPPDERSFAHPVYWATFAYHGV
jgi:CHAT domain-containing protein/tetratricopeptide (TPR) repeat protein